MNDDWDWFDYLRGQLFFSLVGGIILGVVVLGAELLHSISGGRFPSLIESLDKWQPPSRHLINTYDEEYVEDHDDGEEIEEVECGVPAKAPIIINDDSEGEKNENLWESGL